MSNISNQVLCTLNLIFPPSPHKRVIEEYYVKYKGVRLFFDFYVKELSCFFECQGAQHLKFIKHFHKDIDSFKMQKYRDNLKIEYVQENNMYLVRIYDGEHLTPNELMHRIEKAFDSRYNFSD